MDYITRKIDAQLLDWKEDPYRKPLLIRGARQIGKSTTIRHFGKSFSNFVEINFELQPEVRSIFRQETDVHQICSTLSLMFSVSIEGNTTLLFLDEIQACPEAIRSLWAFKENFPELHVIAAGSLLEFALKELPSYGVGRVTSMFMYPMCFEEFLGAMGKEDWAAHISQAGPERPLIPVIHSEIEKLYRQFLVVGGIPASVRAWAETRNYTKCIEVLEDIQQSYFDDFSKYSAKIDPRILRNTLMSVIMQQGHKFVYTKVNGAISIDSVKMALQLLQDAGLVKAISHTAANGLPLGAEVNIKFSRYMYLDTGLFLRVLGLETGSDAPQRAFTLSASPSDLINKGKLAEMSVGWELVKNAPMRTRYPLYYWENLSNSTTSEVDYVISWRGRVLPIEVKAGTSGKMKSLRLFMEKKKIDFAVRSSLENFGMLEIGKEPDISRIEIIPSYAIGRLTSGRDEE